VDFASRRIRERAAAVTFLNRAQSRLSSRARCGDPRVSPRIERFHFLTGVLRIQNVTHYKNVIKKLAWPAGIFFHPAMFSRINLPLGAALVAIGLCSFIPSSPANETLADLFALNDNDDVERDSEDSDSTDPPRPRTRQRAVNAEGTPLPDGGEGLSMALNSATEQCH
jgi:hypothetical protein